MLETQQKKMKHQQQDIANDLQIIKTMYDNQA